MIRFDANCILGRWSTGGPTFESAGELLALMDHLGVSRALVRHAMSIEHNALEGNELLMTQIAGQDRLEPCWMAVPPVTGEMGPLDDWIARVEQANVRAVALCPKSHGYPLTDWQCGDLLAALDEARMLLLLDVAEVTWDEIHTICTAHPALNVLLVNSGYRVLRPLYGLLATHPNVCLELGTISNFTGIEALAGRFGAERLVFGTGEPRIEGAAIVNALIYADLTSNQVEAICSGNLLRLLGGMN